MLSATVGCRIPLPCKRPVDIMLLRTVPCLFLPGCPLCCPADPQRPHAATSIIVYVCVTCKVSHTPGMYKCYLIGLQVLHAPTSIVVKAVYVASNSLRVMLDMTSVMLFDIYYRLLTAVPFGVFGFARVPWASRPTAAG